MREIMFTESNRSGNLLKIYIPGGMVTIEVGLHDRNYAPVTRVSVTPDDEDHGGDGRGFVWHQDGSRLVCQVGTCRYCGLRVKLTPSGTWAAISVQERPALCETLDLDGPHQPEESE